MSSRRRHARRRDATASRSCCSSARSARARSSRCTSGCPTPWKARPGSALIHAATMVTAGVSSSPVPTRSSRRAAARMTVVACRRRHRAARRDDRARPDRHQTRAGLLDGQPARLHVPRARRGRLRGRDLPRRRARVLQGRALPRCRLGGPRQRAAPGHADHGRAAQYMPLTALGSSSPGSRLPACRRSRASGRRTRCSRQRSSPTARACGSSGRRGRDHRVVHDPRRWLVFFGNERLPAADAAATTKAGGPRVPRSRLRPPRRRRPAQTGSARSTRPHESPPTMTLPVIVLAGWPRVGGMLSLPFEGLEFLATGSSPPSSACRADAPPHSSAARSCRWSRWRSACGVGDRVAMYGRGPGDPG